MINAQTVNQIPIDEMIEKKSTTVVGEIFDNFFHSISWMKIKRGGWDKEVPTNI